MTTKTVQHTAGPMEAIVRRDAYLSEEDSILQAAIASDAIRTDLLAALQAAVERMEAVASRIPVHNRTSGVSQATHVAHMAGHLAQHAKVTIP